MAGDWMKVEIATPDKPEVILMAGLLAIDQDAVVGKLLRIWAWTDTNSVDGQCIPITEAFIDRLTSQPGFARALRAAGWLTGEDGQLAFPNFKRHNGSTAKARSNANRRTAKSRAADESCNAPSVTNVTPAPLQKALPEKRREESSTPTPSRPPERSSASPPPQPPIAADPWPALDEVRAHARAELGIIIPPECAESFWNDCEAAGWVNRHGHPLRDWRPALANYARRWNQNVFADRSRDRDRDRTRAPTRHGTAAPLDTRIRGDLIP